MLRAALRVFSAELSPMRMWIPNGGRALCAASAITRLYASRYLSPVSSTTMSSNPAAPANTGGWFVKRSLSFEPSASSASWRGGMTIKNLGRLERVELRDIWLSEATDFTPWLACEENLAILGETLGIDLE